MSRLLGTSQEEAAGLDVGLDIESHGAASARRLSLSDKPLRCARWCCPSLVRWVDALGYDSALVVRDWTHLSLYVSCAVSLACVLLWSSDVLTGGCFLSHPWTVSLDWGLWRCVYEAVGVIVFFGTLREAVVMVGNYDNEHHELLKRKQSLMAELKEDVADAVRKAKANADTLYGMLFQMYQAQLGQHVEQFFDNVLPALHNALIRPGQGHDASHEAKDVRKRAEKLLVALARLLGKNLAEPGDLAVAMCSRLEQVFDKIGPHANDGGVLKGLRASSIGGLPAFWWVWLQERWPLRHPFPDCPALPADQAAQQSQMLARPGAFVFLPVQRMAAALDALSSSEIISPDLPATTTMPQNDALMGTGPAPWDGNAGARVGCRCCMPRMLAACLACACCCFPRERCCGGLLAPGSGDEYPKRLRLGCFWFQIVSRLHERLLSGLVAGALYSLLYVLQFTAELRLGCGPVEQAEFWDCVWETFKRSALLVGLLCNIPALCVCLVRVRQLDAVIRIMEDIRKFEELRGVVRRLDRSMRADSERQALLEAIEDRVLARVTLVGQFRIHVVQLAQQDGQDRAARLLQATECLVSALKQAAALLRPASEWLAAPDGERRERLERLKADLAEVVRSDFAPAAAAGDCRLLGGSSSSSVGSTMSTQSSVSAATTATDASGAPGLAGLSHPPPERRRHSRMSARAQSPASFSSGRTASTDTPPASQVDRTRSSRLPPSFGRSSP